jgi:Polyketide cyclase / dehydrase and lipid transport
MSGKTFSFEINRTSRAPAAMLFRLETDGGNWADWGKPLIVQSSWEQQGDPAPGGIGAIRKVGLWPLLMREKTVEYEQDRRHVYTMVGPPSPAKDYRAEATFTPNAAGGTDIRWRGSFTEGVRGTGAIMRAFLRGSLELIATQLVKAAERELPTGSSRGGIEA